MVLDVNTLDAGTGYLDLGLSIVSPDENLLAYSLDTSGNEVFTLRFRDLRTGADLPDVVEGVGYTGAWTSDSSGDLAFLYTVPDASWRHERIRAHRLGDDPAADVDVLVEPDRRFEVSLRRCRSEQAIVVLSESRDTTEAWYLDPTGADLVPRSLGGRRTGVMYRAEHVRDGELLLVTDDDAVEFRLASCPVPGPAGQDHAVWREVRPEDPAERLERVDAFEGYVVARCGRGGDRAAARAGRRRPGRAGRRVASRSPAARSGWRATPGTTPPPVAVTDESHIEPPVVVARSTWPTAR